MNKFIITALMMTALVAPAMALELGGSTTTAKAGQPVLPAGSTGTVTSGNGATTASVGSAFPVSAVNNVSANNAFGLNAVAPASGTQAVTTTTVAPVAVAPVAAAPMTAGTTKVVMPAMAPATAVAATPNAAPMMAGDAAAVTMPPAAETIPMPAVDTAAPVVETPAPILSTAPSAMGTTGVIGAGQTSAMAPATPAVVPTPAITTPLPPLDGGMASANPLCAPVNATPAQGVEMAGAQPVVNPPKAIPLSVELAGALGIRGFENIKADGPIGYITRDDNGRVMFEGKDLTANVNTLCASGQPIPMPGMAAPAATAPDGSAYSAMPGQGGWKMQPIIDGPNYKYPPKKKKAAVKPKAETEATAEDVKDVTEERLPEAEAKKEAKPAAEPASSDVESLKSMMREPAAKDAAPATTELAPAAAAPTTAVPMTADEPAADAPAATGVVPMPAPTTDTSGEGAVGEVLGDKPVSAE